MKETAKRIIWVDCVKFMAILAVVVDHVNGMMYTSRLIACSSYFSVTTFVLLSGMSTMYSYILRNRKILTIKENFKKLYPLLLQYVIGTVIILSYSYKVFDLQLFIKYLFNFNMEATFYFFLFFFQLKLITPLLLFIYEYCEKKNNSIIYHVITLMAYGVIAALTINYTYILPVHGGGQFLFGGTYLFVYYLGMLLVKLVEYVPNRRYYVIRLGGLFLCWICWIWCMANNLLPFDRLMISLWGGGFNPPSINFIVFSIITILLGNTIFTILGNSKNKIIVKLMQLVVFLGKNTIYIFIYHLLIRKIILDLFPNIINNVFALRVIVFPLMILGAPIIVYFIKKIVCFLKRK